jgi:hypothetical protein
VIYVSHGADSVCHSCRIEPLINGCVVGKRRAICARQRVVVELFCQSSLDLPQAGYLHFQKSLSDEKWLIANVMRVFVIHCLDFGHVVLQRLLREIGNCPECN